MSELFSLFALLVLFVITMFFIVFLHELGHALTRMAVSDGPVSIFIGSFGDVKNSFHVKTGRLITYVRYNPFAWTKGLCSAPKADISINDRILYTAAGPVVTIFTGLIALYCFDRTDPGTLRFELFFFGIYSVFIGGANLIPRTLSARSTGGNILESDGKILVKLFRMKLLPEEYKTASELIYEKDYAQSAEVLQSIIDKGNKNKHVWRLAMSAYTQAKNFEPGDQLMNVFLKKYIPNSDDYCSAGYFKSMLKMDEEAIGLYRKSLSLNSSNIYSLNNIGHSLIVLERYSEAIHYLEAAVAESPDYIFCHENLGLAKIHLGELDSGLESIQKCLQLNSEFPGTYTNLGFYYLKRGELQEAKANFERAKELGTEDSSNDELLHLVEQKLSDSFVNT
jgi:Tfp pilus assembly protein PilF